VYVVWVLLKASRCFPNLPQYLIANTFHRGMQLSVTYIDAILGREVEVATLRGTARLRVPAGVPHRERLSLAVEDTAGHCGNTYTYIQCIII
jgi:DnaJ-class molecular chaperone